MYVCARPQHSGVQWHLKFQANLYLSTLVLLTLQCFNPAIKCSQVLMAVASLAAANFQSKTECLPSI